MSHNQNRERIQTHDDRPYNLAGKVDVQGYNDQTYIRVQKNTEE